MRKAKDIFLQEFRSRPFGWTVQVVGVLIILLNVWLSTKLLPLAQNIDSLIVRVEAAETSIIQLESVSKDHAELYSEAKLINNKIDEVIKRLDRIDARLSKHMGI